MVHKFPSLDNGRSKEQHQEKMDPQEKIYSKPNKTKKNLEGADKGNKTVGKRENKSPHEPNNSWDTDKKTGSEGQKDK